jgi:hypothetical protein
MWLFLLCCSWVSLAAAEDQSPFNGKNLDGWKAKGANFGDWKVGAAKLDSSDKHKFVKSAEGADLINAAEAHGKSFDLYSEHVKHGDAIITLEVMVPQGSNSGVYVMGEYEVQVLDSFGKEKNPGPGDMGAIYGAQPPKNPKYLAPGEWNQYEIHFQAPKFEGDKKIANAKFLKVILNGATIHENVEMKNVTPGGVDGKEKVAGPIMFQGNHGPVAYRKIKIAPLK